MPPTAVKSGPRVVVGLGRSWPPPAEGWPAMPFLHGIRDTVTMDSKDKAVQRTQKGWTNDKRWQKGLECIDGIRDRVTIWQLHLRKERTTGNGIRGWIRRQQLWLESTGNVNETFRETLGLEIAKRIAGFSVRIKKMSVRTLWRGQLPPPPQKKRNYTQSKSRGCRNIDHSWN
jgi:hypothetical protein